MAPATETEILAGRPALLDIGPTSSLATELAVAFLEAGGILSQD